MKNAFYNENMQNTSVKQMCTHAVGVHFFLMLKFNESILILIQIKINFIHSYSLLIILN